MLRLKLFRLIALVEGVTTVALFCIAMPMKYWFDNPALVPPVGMTHGVAFLVYLPAMVIGLWGTRAGWLGWLRTLAASFVPFGTFINDPFVKRLRPAGAPVALKVRG